MSLFIRRSTIAFAIILLSAPIGFAQLLQPSDADSDAVRVIVKMNADGSRSVYKFDDARRKCTAVTTGEDGKLREKVRYELDEAGRFSTGQIFGPDGRLRYKSRYKYNSAGRMEEEVQMDEKDVVLHKIVYSYDGSGKQTGYSVLDGSGKLLGRATGPVANPSSAPKSRQKK